MTKPITRKTTSNPAEQAQQDIYTRVTAKILTDLENGNLSWRKPWHSEHMTGQVMRPLRWNDIPYTGINTLILWNAASDQGFTSPYWMTFQQATEMKANVRKGEKGTQIVYADKFTKAEEDANGEIKSSQIPFLKCYTVFNASQIDGLSDAFYKTPEPVVINQQARNQELEQFFGQTKADIYTGTKACYIPSTDRIQMPPFESFETAMRYYAILAHEVCHWTKPPHRLNRDFAKKQYGDEGYAKEELVAELGACFLAADLGDHEQFGCAHDPGSQTPQLMVIRGAIRGDGKQLAHYLLSGEANERVQVVDVAGRSNATDAYLHQTLQGMSLTSELTKSQKGLYHAQINPAYSEDRKMSEKDWLKAADIFGNELGLQEQRRVIVLHTKKGRTHAHVVWERYDHKTGKVIANKFSRLAQDRARKEMERVFEQQPTPHRNQHRPELKEALTNLWNDTETGKDFVKAVHDNGYLLAEGVPRHPFMVVDENGRSFDLVRQLKGVRIKEVRQRLRHEKLIPEKEAIELMRQKQEGSSDANRAAQHRNQDTAKRTASAFWENKQDMTLEDAEAQSRKRMKDLADSFIQSGQEMTKATDQADNLQKKKRRAGEYFLNSDELTGKAEETIAEEPATQLVDGYPETQEEITTKPQSIESRQRQQRIGEQFAANEEDTSQPRVELDNKQHRNILKEFMQSGEELVDQNEPLQEETVQRQQTAARQFFENEELTTAEVVDDTKELQRLMQEQKEIRERNRQRGQKRSR